MKKGVVLDPLGLAPRTIGFKNRPKQTYALSQIESSSNKGWILPHTQGQNNHVNPRSKTQLKVPIRSTGSINRVSTDI